MSMSDHCGSYNHIHPTWHSPFYLTSAIQEAVWPWGMYSLYGQAATAGTYKGGAKDLT